MLEIIKKYKWSFIGIAAIIILNIFDKSLGEKAFFSSLDSIITIFILIPPILVLVSLMDIWIPKEFIIKHMGKDAGIKGFFFAFIFGSIAVGPLYIAFPIAALLMKKEARFRYVIFFLGVWSSTKLPILIYEYQTFGMRFTILHVGISLSMYVFGSYLIEAKLIKQVINKE